MGAGGLRKATQERQSPVRTNRRIWRGKGNKCESSMGSELEEKEGEWKKGGRNSSGRRRGSNTK